eukprot:TRINITY_DN1587_c0_g1_i1.p1 TRINITY_DN1587_c0_g1~~TRINITY_DN1587_c0_g1_i1.p1  ORF type:complete len:442 (+),score=65.28 TRINITY_DN1587_c0_g1_i1:943-2268(+)
MPAILPPDYSTMHSESAPGGLSLQIPNPNSTNDAMTTSDSGSSLLLTPDLPTPTVGPATPYGGDTGSASSSMSNLAAAAVTQMTAIDVYNLMSTQPAASNKYPPLMLIDVRSREKYQQVHIVSAINIPLESFSSDPQVLSQLTMEQIQGMCSDEVKAKFEWHGMHRIIVYGSTQPLKTLHQNLLRETLVPSTPSSAHVDTQPRSFNFQFPQEGQAQAASNASAVAANNAMAQLSPAAVAMACGLQSQRSTHSVHLLTQPEEFCNEFPFLTIQGKIEIGSLSYSNQHPTMILPQLFLGTFQNACNHPVLRDLQITHILNCASECQYPSQAEGIEYRMYPVADDPDDHIQRFFAEAHEFLDQALASGPSARVLVHCHMGQSRAAALTISYLMKRHCVLLDEALDFVKRRRESISPNPGFLFQLHEFQGEIIARKKELQSSQPT